MSNYIDAFILPVPRDYLEDYKRSATQVAAIWKEYGATAYFEYAGDELHTAGLRSSVDTVGAKEDEQIIFGWTVFPSKHVRDEANKKVPADPRMAAIVAPLTDPKRLIFDAGRMVFGGFEKLVE